MAYLEVHFNALFLNWKQESSEFNIKVSYSKTDLVYMYSYNVKCQQNKANLRVNFTLNRLLIWN